MAIELLKRFGNLPWGGGTIIAGATDTRGWTYNLGSGEANSKIDYTNSTSYLNGTYTMHRDNTVFDEFDSLIKLHSPKHGHKITHVAKLRAYVYV